VLDAIWFRLIACNKPADAPEQLYAQQPEHIDQVGKQEAGIFGNRIASLADPRAALLAAIVSPLGTPGSDPNQPATSSAIGL
jgi:hypothetical protein